MTGKSHLALGVATATSICYISQNLSEIEGVCFVAGTALGAIFPDIDTKQSKISNRYPMISFITRLFVGHRGIIHTPVCLLALVIAFVVSRLIIPIPIPFFIGFVVGYLLHLMQDTFTRRGIRWLYPLSQKYYSIIGIRNNGLGELVFSLAIYFAIMFLYIFFNPQFMR